MHPITSTAPLADLVQSVVSWPWPDTPRALEACRARAWPAFVTDSAPLRPLLFGRLDHAACVRQASGMFDGPRDVLLELFPVWVGDTPDELPAAEWWAVHAMRVDAGPLYVVETAPHGEDAPHLLTQAVHCRGRAWRAGVVVHTARYAPDVPLALRRGAFGVLDVNIYEVLDAQEREGAPLPRPALVVPPFSRWLEPRVTGLPEKVHQQLHALDLTVGDDGSLVARPTEPAAKSEG